MTGNVQKRVLNGSQGEMRTCAGCQGLFVPTRVAQAFCCTRCRQAFHIDVGTTGRVASVRRIGRGTSLVIHLTGPAAEAALQLKIGASVRLVPEPMSEAST